MYYRLDFDPSLRAGYVQKLSNKHETLISGQPIDESTLKLPWSYSVVFDEDEGLELCDFYPDKNLMSKRLVAELQACGVDNLQTFPAEIANKHAGNVIGDYLAVNVLGLVECADAGASSSSPLADGQYFHKLVIDPAKTRGLLMFRLAESRMEIIIAEKVARALLAKNFVDLTVQPLEQS